MKSIVLFISLTTSLFLSSTSFAAEPKAYDGAAAQADNPAEGAQSDRTRAACDNCEKNALAEARRTCATGFRSASDQDLSKCVAAIYSGKSTSARGTEGNDNNQEQ